MVLDEYDIKYLLKKNGYSYSKVAEDLNVSIQMIYGVTKGTETSHRIISYIEKLLGMKTGTLSISKERRPSLVKVA